MAFVKFEQEISRGGMAEPRVSINSANQICFNHKAAEEMKLGPVKFVTLYWDGADEIIGIKPCPESEAYAVPLRAASKKDGARYIPSKMFFRHFGIENSFTGLKRRPIFDGEMILFHTGEVPKEKGKPGRKPQA